MPIIDLEHVRSDCLKLYAETGSKIDCIKFLRKELDIPLQDAKQLFEMEYDPAARAARRLRDAAPDLLEALDKDAARLKRIREKLDGWNDMTGNQRADFRNWIWHAECETRVAIAKARQP